jgi:SNF2 family DNA or RNA helicase
VVLCEPVLNPTYEEQAVGRCNRLGQLDSVTVTRLVMKGGSMGPRAGGRSRTR